MYISSVSVYVSDVDRAIDFYTHKLGWEVTMDAAMGEDQRWVTVAPKGAQTAFVLVKGYGDWSPEKVGGFSGTVIEVDDVFKTHKDFSGKGIEFSEGPTVHFWGGWAQFKDSEGNEHGLHSPAPAIVSAN